MESNQAVKLLREIRKIDARQGGFTIIFENGVSPNLLDCVQTIAPDWLKDMELTDKETKLLDNEYPYKKALEILKQTGFRNCRIII